MRMLSGEARCSALREKTINNARNTARKIRNRLESNPNGIIKRMNDSPAWIENNARQIHSYTQIFLPTQFVRLLHHTILWLIFQHQKRRLERAKTCRDEVFQLQRQTLEQPIPRKLVPRKPGKKHICFTLILFVALTLLNGVILGRLGTR